MTTRPVVTDEEVARMRSQVPDDPIKIPEHFLACEACGVAVPVPPERSVEPLPMVPRDLVPKKRRKFARCQKVREQADEYVTARPRAGACCAVSCRSRAPLSKSPGAVDPSPQPPPCGDRS